MKITNVLVFLVCLSFIIACGKKDENKAGAASGHTYTYKSMSDRHSRCETLDHTFTGSSDQDAKQKYCRGLMDNQLNRNCAQSERQRKFQNECRNTHMVFDPQHAQNNGTYRYSQRFRVRNRFNGGGWHWINVSGNSYDQYSERLRIELLREEHEFKMGMQNRRTMFNNCFPSASFYVGF